VANGLPSAEFAPLAQTSSYANACSHSLIRTVKPDRPPIMAAAPSVHTPTQKDQFSFLVKYSFRDLNSSEAVVFFYQERST